MEYRQSFDKEALLKIGIDTALDDIRAELAENLLSVNNKYCSIKYSVIADVFTGFPASQDYDSAIKDIVPLGKSIVVLSYGAEGLNDYYKEKLLNNFFDKREELKVAMKNV